MMRVVTLALVSAALAPLVKAIEILLIGGGGEAAVDRHGSVLSLHFIVG